MDNEWGRLREVIVGIVPDNAIVPLPISSHFKNNSPKTITCFQQCHEKPAKQALPEAFTVARRQVEALVQIYEKTGIKVHRPRPHTETELRLFKMGGAPLYARDSMLVVGQNVIELSLRDPSRRKEILPTGRCWPGASPRPPGSNMPLCHLPCRLLPPRIAKARGLFSKGVISSSWVKTFWWATPGRPAIRQVSAGCGVFSAPRVTGSRKRP